MNTRKDFIPLEKAGASKRNKTEILSLTKKHFELLPGSYFEIQQMLN